MSAKKTDKSLRWKVFLKALAAEVAVPTAEHLTARCWSRNDLYALFSRVTARTDLPLEFSNTEGFLAYLREVGWVSQVALDQLTKAGPTGGFYLLDPSAVATGTPPDPLELLQAYQSAGVICYFSALAYHSLTTQLPSHHHVANPCLSAPSQDGEPCQPKRPHVEGPPRSNPTEQAAEEGGSTIGRRKRNPLGTEVFTYQGVPCYLHRRRFALRQGAQVRDVDARTRLRITSREQTLLDTLQTPAACGGAAVVFEAWENGVVDLDEERLAERLRAQDHPLAFRRVGAMLERLGYQAGHALQGLLRERELLSEERCLPSTPAAPGSVEAAAADVAPPAPQAVALLPGYPFATLMPRWGVLAP